MKDLPQAQGRDVLNVDEAAGLLGVHPNTVRDMIQEGAIRARRVGRAWKIPLTAYREFLEGRDNPACVLSMDELAGALGVHRNLATAMVQEGAIRARKVGKSWKIPQAALDEFLAGRDNPEPKE